MTSEKPPLRLLTTGLTCLMVASAGLFSILYEVLSALKQVTTLLSLNYITATTNFLFTLLFSFQLLLVLVEVVSEYNILNLKFKDF